MTRPSKARIRQSFERAAPTYDSAAGIQRQICADLAAGLPAITPARILDAGCGTGHALTALRARFPAAQTVALDLSPAMLHRVKTPCSRLTGDLEHLPLADASLDLYWSSLAVQWCDLATVLREARRVLTTQGVLALATLGPETFRELRHAFSGVDAYAHTLDFHGPDEIGQIAADAGFATVSRKKTQKTEYFPDFRTLLRAVKAIGANQVGAGRRAGLMSRSAFQRAEAACEQLRAPAGLPLTYDVITLYARP
ncbi:MAG: malonyl-ACP O-methyltransferase BioC [Rhodocyclaceae bacterium]|jgi:malonyl-CoA O-methyltransferase|nr:MAG: malonyl-ACP O-methyltransferase BioC [Rhodocyclaceae bacterium]